MPAPITPRSPITHTRWGLIRDIPAILDIEAASFSEPWDRSHFLTVLRQRNCIMMIGEDRNADILSYMIYELHESHIVLANFAVHPAHRRSGAGSAMMAKLVYKLCSHRREKLVADVSESNIGAHLFFRACGFVAVAVHRDVYDNGESCYTLEFRPPLAVVESYENKWSARD